MTDHTYVVRMTGDEWVALLNAVGATLEMQIELCQNSASYSLSLQSLYEAEQSRLESLLAKVRAADIEGI